MFRFGLTVAFLAALSFAPSAFAYIGPGAGMSVVGSLLNTLLIFLLAVIAIVFWPLRLLWRKIKGRRQKIHRSDDHSPPGA